ncbi:probable bifunctional dTTP/UTP pyrophosphatase/methyltransferase protein [Anneissia japonica]|uniref:probable bifunctional dTTP/UTP pyrophosphatase/methyltransferase protein n=1 Tax=Anneissia japonica TaxID=1529436 RepID=UPI0014257307|nr:probable bifunctional dTTP/UTP pyrophosphatase/methyltransferase protein [Anneissia japonica]
MLHPILSELSLTRIVLASGSPRRREILNSTGLTFDVIPSKFDENLDKSQFESPVDYVKETARRKTDEVRERLSISGKASSLIIGADTVVALDGKIMEKPTSKSDATSMLTNLSGKTHSVYTGVVLSKVLQNGTLKQVIFHEKTDVKFGNLPTEVIKSYVDTGEPMDKAGGYGIQAIGGTLVEGICGDYYNVVGFPLHHFCVEMLKLYDNKGGTQN